MRSLHRTILLALPLFSTVLSEEPKPASPTKSTIANPFYANANEAFQDLLNALPEESLHVALNSLTKFKDGVFESDRHGVERVHNENPPLATKLIVAAVRDLKKRQAPTNGTQGPSTPTQSSDQTPPSSEPLPPESSKESAVIVPVPITTTDSNGQATVVSSAILSKPTASVAIPVTRTNAEGSTFVSQETKPAVIFTATDSEGSVFTTTSAVDFAPTSGQVLTTTDDKGSTFLTTYTPGGGRVQSVVLITTVGQDGRPSVITSYTFVEPAAATNTNGQPPPSGASTGKPGLQSAAAHKNRAMGAAIVGGAVGGAFALLI